MSESVQHYLDLLGKLLLARREHGGPLPQEEEVRYVALLDKLWSTLSKEEQEQLETMSLTAEDP